MSWFAFQGFYKRDRETQEVPVSGQHLSMDMRIERPKQYNDHARAMAQALNEMSVPQERGRFTHRRCSQRDLETLRSRRSEARPR